MNSEILNLSSLETGKYKSPWKNSRKKVHKIVTNRNSSVYHVFNRKSPRANARLFESVDVMGLFTKGSRSLRIISMFAAVTMAYSSSAKGFNVLISSIATTLALQGGGSHYTDTPYVPNTLPNPVVQLIRSFNRRTVGSFICPKISMPSRPHFASMQVRFLK